MVPVTARGDTDGMGRRVSRSVLMTGVVVAGLTGALGAAFAEDPAASTPPSVEAWYRTSASCATPLGCPSLPMTYPADTFHVGVTLGAEDSRSYLQLDLSALPAGATPTGGQLLLPLGTSQDGTANAQAARLRACLAPQAVQPAEGTATTTPPPADCSAASVDATYSAATGTAPAGFAVDLGPLLAAWRSSVAPGALALLPADGLQPSDTWQLSFNDQARAGDGIAKPSATVTYASAPVAGGSSSPPSGTAGQDSRQGSIPTTSELGTSLPVGTLPGTAPAFPAPSVATAAGGAAQRPAVAAPQGPVALPPVARTAFVPGSFRYPAVFLLPLLFGAAAGWAGRALTRDLQPQPR